MIESLNKRKGLNLDYSKILHSKSKSDQCNVLMVVTFLAALPTLLVYMFLGRFFLRGLMAGALKG